MQASDNSTRLGEAVLNDFNVFTEKNWFWIGSAALLGFAILFNVLFTLALMYLSRKKSTFFSMFISLLFSVLELTNFLYIVSNS